MKLRAQDRQRILEIAARTLTQPVAIWAYGSRVDGSAHDCSDLDLVIRTPELTPLAPGELLRFREALEESTIPILIQVLDWARIPDAFHRNILRNYEVLQPLPDRGSS